MVERINLEVYLLTINLSSAENIEFKEKIRENEAEVEEKRAEYQEHSEKYDNLYEEYRKLAEIRAPKNVKVSRWFFHIIGRVNA